MSMPNEVLPEPGWNDLEPLLNDAMQELSELDREAVILRYFQEEPLARVAEAIGSSENAARMRVERALEKLRVVLQRRGIQYSSAALAATLAANSVLAAPAGLGASITAISLASATIGPSVGLLTFMSAAKLKTAAVLVVVAGTTTGLVLSQRHNTELKDRLARAEQQLAALSRPEPPDSSRIAVDASELAKLRAANSEMMRLRAEITNLRTAERAQADQRRADQTGRARASVTAEREEQLRTLGMEAKMSVAKAWGLAFHKFAEANDGQMPRDLEEAALHYPELPGELKWMQSLAGGEFEITYTGALSQIENPAQAIVLRERKPFNLRDDGGSDRTYLFADGHSEIHHAADGNFEPWEQRHQPRLRTSESKALE